MVGTKSGIEAFTEEEWARIESLLPSNQGVRARPFANDRRVASGVICRYRAGIPRRDLQREFFGPWQTVWKRHRKYASDRTWDRALVQIIAEAGASSSGIRGGITAPRRAEAKLRGPEMDWTVSIDGTSTVLVSTRRTPRALTSTQGAEANYTNLPDITGEPAVQNIAPVLG